MLLLGEAICIGTKGKVGRFFAMLGQSPGNFFSGRGWDTMKAATSQQSSSESTGSGVCLSKGMLKWMNPAILDSRNKPALLLKLRSPHKGG
jgi:hypothetical protein